MRFLFLFLLPLLLFSKPFKVATYNVENLFDAVFQGSEYKEYIPNKHNWTKAMAEKKLNHTAEVICDLDADIIGLQEIENSTVFEALKKRLKRVGCEYRYGAITHKRGTSIQVAMLSHFPIERVNELQVSYAPRIRNILEVEINVEGRPLILFVNHWKSKSRKGQESKRIAYAKTLKKRIDIMPKGKEYIIIGDLNSNYDAYLTLPKRIDDTGKRTALNHILKTLKNNVLVNESDMISSAKGIHYDLWLELPFSKRWSHKFYGNSSTLDHILLPKSMFDGKGVEYVNNSFAVFRPPYLFTKKGYINSWQIKGGKHTGKGYSDHLPVFAYFDTKPYKREKETKQSIQKNGTIEQLYKMEKLSAPVKLEDVVVMLKRGRYAIVKQKAKGRGIFLFACVNGLKEGRKYDILVQEIAEYKGLKEITAQMILKEKSKVALGNYYASLVNLRQNEVLKNIVGVYKQGKLVLEGQKIPLYFKNRKFIPKNGMKIKIAYAHVGYYKKIQLVIYSKKDFEILER
ncbi:MAG: hypothetical protein P794_04820 [Epsilonproteobacteria bacterium (ex Lamellibrachia satsuma)]|nr:MAG: hypothetical protein P794_04820 [Epsilonproteobacteria bacterium (ex Lamellibrachia satsuma)]